MKIGNMNYEIFRIMMSRRNLSADSGFTMFIHLFIKHFNYVFKQRLGQNVKHERKTKNRGQEYNKTSFYNHIFLLWMQIQKPLFFYDSFTNQSNCVRNQENYFQTWHMRPQYLRGKKKWEKTLQQRRQQSPGLSTDL